MAASPARTRLSVAGRVAIEAAAFRLFHERGFDNTTTEQIAQSLGVSRRTLFRYFPSKNDIPWGQFDESLRQFRQHFDSVPLDTPLADAVHRCVVSFNSFDDSALDQHRFRMKLIRETPALQAYSAIKYEAWRRVIAEFVAQRLHVTPDDRFPRLVGHVSLAVSMAAYEHWLDHPGASLGEVLSQELDSVREYLA